MVIKKVLVVIVPVLVLIFLFSPVFFQQKTLFPANLLVASYAPWEFEPPPEYPHGPPNKPMGFDDIRQFFPNRVLLRNALLSGTIPLWNPYIYSGTPFMAAFDTSVWYPLSWISSLLPPVQGWNLLVLIEPVLSILFMYLFLRAMKFDTWVALYGAIAWALSGWMVVYWQEILVVEHSFLWLPLALYGSVRKDKMGFVLLAAALALSVFGGFLQMSVYVYAVVLAWNLLFRNRKAIIAVGISLLIVSVQLIPSVEAFLMSPRGLADGYATFKNALLPLTHLFTFIAPDFWGNPATYNYFGGAGFYFEKMIYIGIFPLLFALYAFRFVRANRTVLFFGITALIALSLGFALPTSWLPYILKIPVLSNSYPTRTFAVSAFSLVVLSSYGLSAFLKKPEKKLFVSLLALLTGTSFIGFFVVGGARYGTDHCQPAGFWCRGIASALWNGIARIADVRRDASWYISVSSRNLILPLLCIGAGWMLLFIPKRVRYAAVLLLTVFSGLYFAHKYLYFSEPRFVYPSLPVTRELSGITNYDRIWGYGNAFIEKNIPQYFGWFSTDGYGNLSSNRYAQLLSTIVNGGKLGGPIRRSDTDIYAASEWDAMDTNPYRLRLMSLLGVKYVLETKAGELKDKRTSVERFPDGIFSPVWENDTWKIWEYKDAAPRAVYATSYEIKTSPQDIVDAIYAKDTNLAKTVILETDPKRQLIGGTGSAQIKNYGYNSFTVQTDSGVPGFVMVTDNYFPGWTARVDGTREPIYRADYAFKAVYVPAGVHNLEFTYFPRSVIAGAVLSCIGIALLILV